MKFGMIGGSEPIHCEFIVLVIVLMQPEAFVTVSVIVPGRLVQLLHEIALAYKIRGKNYNKFRIFLRFQPSKQKTKLCAKITL